MSSSRRRRIKNIEMILYEKALCPYCRLLKDLVLRDVLSDRRIAEKIPFYEVDVSRPITHWNPNKFISEEGKIHVIDLSGKKAEVISGIDIRDYAHLLVSTPILEVRLYVDDRVDKYIFLGFLGPTMKDFRQRVLMFKVNLMGLLRAFTRNL